MRQTGDKIAHLVIFEVKKIQYLVKNAKKILTKFVEYGKIKDAKLFVPKRDLAKGKGGA